MAQNVFDGIESQAIVPAQDIFRCLTKIEPDRELVIARPLRMRAARALAGSGRRQYRELEQ
jgi:hypothetical protein